MLLNVQSFVLMFVCVRACCLSSWMLWAPPTTETTLPQGTEGTKCVAHLHLEPNLQHPLQQDRSSIMSGLYVFLVPAVHELSHKPTYATAAVWGNALPWKCKIIYHYSTCSIITSLLSHPHPRPTHAQACSVMLPGKLQRVNRVRYKGSTNACVNTLSHSASSHSLTMPHSIANTATLLTLSA